LQGLTWFGICRQQHRRIRFTTHGIKGTSGYIKVCKGLHCRNRMPVVIKAFVCFINCPPIDSCMYECVRVFGVNIFVETTTTIRQPHSFILCFHQTVRITTVVFSRHCKQCSEGVLRDMVSSCGKKERTKQASKLHTTHCHSLRNCMFYSSGKADSSSTLNHSDKRPQGSSLHVMIQTHYISFCTVIVVVWYCAASLAGKSTLRQE
jgi:hypothetical protein